MDEGLDNEKEDMEKVLEELNKSKPEEEKNVKTSDPKHCDNDPECVLPDLSLEKENKGRQEATTSQQKVIKPPDKTSHAKSNQEGDPIVSKDLVSQIQEDCQQQTESMIELHDNIIPLDYLKAVIRI